VLAGFDRRNSDDAITPLALKCTTRCADHDGRSQWCFTLADKTAVTCNTCTLVICLSLPMCITSAETYRQSPSPLLSPQVHGKPCCNSLLSSTNRQAKQACLMLSSCSSSSSSILTRNLWHPVWHTLLKAAPQLCTAACHTKRSSKKDSRIL